MRFSFSDYKKALKGAGLKTKKNIIDRAINDQNLSWSEIKALIDYAYPGGAECRE